MPPAVTAAMQEQSLHDLLDIYTHKVEPYIDSCIAKHQLELAQQQQPSQTEHEEEGDPLLHRPRIVAALSTADAERALLECLLSLQPNVATHAQWIQSLRYLASSAGSKLAATATTTATVSSHVKTSHVESLASQHHNAASSSQQHSIQSQLNADQTFDAPESQLPFETQASVEYMPPATAELQQQQKQQQQQQQQRAAKPSADTNQDEPQQRNNASPMHESAFKFTNTQQSEISPIQVVQSSNNAEFNTDASQQPHQFTPASLIIPLTQSQSEPAQQQDWTAASIARQLSFALDRMSLHENQQSKTKQQHKQQVDAAPDDDDAALHQNQTPFELPHLSHVTPSANRHVTHQSNVHNQNTPRTRNAIAQSPTTIKTAAAMLAFEPPPETLCSPEQSPAASQQRRSQAPLHSPPTQSFRAMQVSPQRARQVASSNALHAMQQELARTEHRITPATSPAAQALHQRKILPVEQLRRRRTQVLSDLESEEEHKYSAPESDEDDEAIQSSGEEGKLTSPDCNAHESIINRSRSMPAAKARSSRHDKQQQRTSSAVIQASRAAPLRTSDVRRKKFVKQKTSDASSAAARPRMKMGVLDFNEYNEPPRRVVSPRRTRRRKA